VDILKIHWVAFSCCQTISFCNDEHTRTLFTIRNDLRYFCSIEHYFLSFSAESNVSVDMKLPTAIALRLSIPVSVMSRESRLDRGDPASLV
jgi:hypothetical protein